MYNKCMRFLKPTSAFICGALRFSSNTNTFGAHQSLVICGPSGVGKGTLISSLLTTFPKAALSVSHTSRLPRPGEVDGQHYHFVTKDRLLADIASSTITFLEHAEVHGNIYGTSHQAVKAIHDQGKLCVLDVDTLGVKRFKSNNFSAKYVFIAPPSASALEARLKHRGSESEEQVSIRLKNSMTELEYGNTNNFDMVLVNDLLDVSIKTLTTQVSEWFPWLNH